MAFGKPIGRALASIVSYTSTGYFTDVDGPTSVGTANGLGQRNPIGMHVVDDLGNEYIYLVGVASTAAGDWVKFVPGAFTTARLVANTAVSGPVAVACAATVASCWGWYQIYGLSPTFTAVATDAAADGKIVSMGASGSDGRVLTGPTTTKNIIGAVCVGAAANNVGTVALNYPFIFGTATI